MALTSGTRLGVYEITAQIGEGGMGAVYRATDTSLSRQVAIKVLPDAFAADPDRLARFEREAKTLAALNHPHIAAIYGFEKSAGQHALVMELVEGDDLSERIARLRGPGASARPAGMPLDEALAIATQIAEALEAAHEPGIIHRDLKPANIKVRDDGTVKVLDFGLAKAIDSGAGGAGVYRPDPSGPPGLTSPTLTSPAQRTGVGVILGTAAYMAPEQAKGKAVDKRADIWAFGVVLYEMLAGRSAFAGETVTDIIAAGVTRDADWTALPAATPASIRRLLARCLEKDPRRRVRDIGDVRFEIDETIARGFSDARSVELESTPVRPARVPLGRKRVPAAGGPVRVITDSIGPWNGYGASWAVGGTIAVGGQGGLFRVPAEGGERTALTKPPSGDWAHFWPSFLPDGRRFLFTAKLWTRTAETSDQGIYLGSLDSPTIERLLPDLSSVVYAAPGYLVFVREGMLSAAPFDLAAGRVTGAPIAIGGAVATDASLYFAGISASADGTLAIRPPPAVVLPDSNTLETELRLVDRTGTSSRVGAARLFSYFMALSPVDSRTLAISIQDPRSGTVDLSLMDLSTDRTEPLATTRGFTAAPVWSTDGKRLAYAYQLPGQIDDVYIKDLRTGAIEAVIKTPTLGEHPLAWSHDGRSLLVFAYEEFKATLSSWSFASNTLTPLTGPGAVESAAFSPRDDYVAFASRESGRPEVYVTTFPDHRQTWPVTTEGGQVLSWSSDGREILVATLSGHIVAYPVSTDGGFSRGQPTTLLHDLGAAAAYSTATRDHSRILVRVRPDAAKDKGEIRLLFGWQEGLPRVK